MRFSVEKFSKIGERDEFSLANLTHAYPEWDKYRGRFAAAAHGREEMDYKDFLIDADPNHPDFLRLQFRDPFPPLTSQERADIYNEMIERTLAFA